VVSETMHTLVVDRGDDLAQVPKAVATFVFDLADGPVAVDGERLVARPAERTERGGDSVWR
jgi:RNase P/RNase MRP subunit p29